LVCIVDAHHMGRFNRAKTSVRQFTPKPGRDAFGPVILLAVSLVFTMVVVPMGSTAQHEPVDESRPGQVSVVVRSTHNDVEAAESAVTSIGGTVVEALPLIDGFSATVPGDSIAELSELPGVQAVTPNARLQLSGAGWEDAATLNGMDPKAHPGSLYEVTKFIQARQLWRDGHTGGGVDIAMIDSGVVPVNGLTAPGKIINGPDLSFESQFENLRYLDTFGHGTHMAGIIAGRDDEVGGDYAGETKDHFLGVAPDARIVSIKVADAHGVTDVSQVIAAIDWVVEHRTDNGMNIRVLSLAFGTNSSQSYVLDPLAFAVEQAWDNGILVVVAAGNDGNGYALRNPALDPFVVAVGALDRNGTKGRSDDAVASFSNCGTPLRHVDMVAPGRSITSLRAPGSFIDAENPRAVVAERFFLGSGTSQATAVVSGVAALLLDENPALTPDQLKSILMSGASAVSTSSALSDVAGSLCSGSGTVDANMSASEPVPVSAQQAFAASTGLGTLEGARGSDHLTADGVVLEGEIDIMGKDFVTEVWAPLAASQDAWTGGTWNGSSWSGSSWSGSSWSGSSWSGSSWSGSSWSGSSWSSINWSGSSWSGSSWSGSSWSGSSWSGSSWSGSSWSGSSWSGSSWSSANPWAR
jgi:serine protease AprX